MNSNPFNYHLPVTPKNFVGRWAEVNLITRSLSNLNGESFVVIAGRRCGKSSFLEAVADQLVREKEYPGSFRTLPVIFDLKCQEFKSSNQIFSRLLHSVQSKVDINEEWRFAGTWNKFVDLEAAWFKNLLEKSSLELFEFERALHYILLTLDQTYSDGTPTRVVLLVDEMDEALGHNWTEGLLNQMRSLVNSSPLRDRVRWVLAGSHHLLEDVQFRGSSLWNMLEKHYLVAFNNQGIVDLMKPATGLPQKVKKLLVKQSGNHPFMAQYLLHHLWEKGVERCTISDIDDLVARFYVLEHGTLIGWKNALGPLALRIFKYVVSMNRMVDEIEIIQALGEPGDKVKNNLIALTCHGVIIHEGWRRYTQQCGIFQCWIDRLGIDVSTKE